MTHDATVIFAGGGSGGHLYPNLAVAERLRELRPAARLLFLISSRDIDASIARSNHLDAIPLPAAPLSIRPPGALRFLRAWPPSVRATRRIIRDSKARGPVAMLASGGFVSAPAMRAAALEHLWSAVVNLDATPGKASRFAARLTTERYIVSNTPPEGWRSITPVVRAAFDHLPAPPDARRALQLDPDAPTLLVTGGSQGARSLNRAVAAVLRAKPPALAGWQALHQATGPDAQELTAAYAHANIPARVLPYLEDMPGAWAAADLAIARAGAGTVAEARASTTPLLALPYPHHADHHQLANLADLHAAGVATAVIDRVDPEKTAPALLDELAAVISELPSRRAAAQALPPATGALDLARLLERALAAPQTRPE